MGYPMAGHLARAGHAVTVYNRTTSKATRWQSEFAGKVAVTPAAAARDAEFVFSCVGNDDGAALPTTAVVDQFYGALQQRGRHRLDTSSLITLLQDT